MQKIALLLLFSNLIWSMDPQKPSQTDGVTKQDTPLFFTETGDMMTAAQWEFFYKSSVDSEWSKKKQEEDEQLRLLEYFLAFDATINNDVKIKK